MAERDEARGYQVFWDVRSLTWDDSWSWEFSQQQTVSLKQLGSGFFVSTFVTEARVQGLPTAIEETISCCLSQFIRLDMPSEDSEMRGEMLLGLHRCIIHLMFLFSKHCFEDQTCVVSKRSSEDDRNGWISGFLRKKRTPDRLNLLGGAAH